MISIELRLYTSGPSPQAHRAMSNLDRICKNRLTGQCTVEVVNLVEHPHRADQDRIIATPTLPRIAPKPVRRVIGDLSDRTRVLSALGVSDDPANPENAFAAV